MTKLKVTIIGNSHAATLKKALTQNPALNDEFDITFFVVGGLLHYNFYLDPDLTFRLPEDFAVTQDENRYLSGLNGSDRIDLRNSENVFYIGRDFGEIEAAELSLGYDVDQIALGGRQQRLSKLAFEGYCKELAHSFLPPGRWLQPLPFHLTVATAPYPGSSLAKTDDFHPGARRWKPVVDDPRNMKSISKAYEACLSTILDAYGIAFLPQPESTFDANGLTLPEFVRDKTEMHPNAGSLDDFRHMNAEFGLRTLNAYFESLKPRTRAE